MRNTTVEDAPSSHGVTPETRLQRRWLLIARGVWIALVVLTLAIFFASLPVYLTLLQTPCAGTACEYQQLTPGQIEMLRGMGVSLDAYVVYTVALTLAVLVVCLAVSAVIVWRRPADRMAFLVALMLVTLGPVVETTAVPQRPSAWQVPNECLMLLFLALFLLVFSLFPTGQFVPRWTRWLFVVFLVVQVPLAFWQTGPLIPNSPGSQPGWLVSVGEIATLAFVQLYRYRRVSSPRERQQTKWVVFGLAVPITVAVSMSMPYLVFPALASPGSLYPLMYNQVSIGLSLSISLSFGFAILRSRLWEIDTLINKALVYGLLTGLLAALYAGLIIALESLADVMSGGQASEQPLVLVVSTLVIAALFLPLRRRIQAIIDHRFYRKKYDVEKTLAAFSASLRNQVDLEQIQEQLLAVVQGTMQPASVSLWLRQPERPHTASAHRYWLISSGPSCEGTHQRCHRTLSFSQNGPLHPV
jgi:hypothetical protein